MPGARWLLRASSVPDTVLSSSSVLSSSTSLTEQDLGLCPYSLIRNMRPREVELVQATRLNLLGTKANALNRDSP